MVLACPSCGKRYSLDDAKVARRGAKITCPDCAHKFVVYPEGMTVPNDGSSAVIIERGARLPPPAPAPGPAPAPDSSVATVTAPAKSPPVSVPPAELPTASYDIPDEVTLLPELRQFLMPEEARPAAAPPPAARAVASPTPAPAASSGINPTALLLAGVVAAFAIAAVLFALIAMK